MKVRLIAGVISTQGATKASPRCQKNRLQGLGLEELITSYRNKALAVHQEVEDALAAFLENRQRIEHPEINVAETGKTLRLLTTSFKEGDISFTRFFVLQGSLAAR